MTAYSFILHLTNLKEVEKDVEDSLHFGAVSFITKPNKFEQLVHSISNVLGGKYSGVNKHS